MSAETSEVVTWTIPSELAEYVRNAARINQQDENEIARVLLEEGRDNWVCGGHCPRCRCQQPGYVETCRFCDGQPCKTPGRCEGEGGCECDVRECLDYGCDHSIR